MRGGPELDRIEAPVRLELLPRFESTSLEADSLLGLKLWLRLESPDLLDVFELRKRLGELPVDRLPPILTPRHDSDGSNVRTRTRRKRSKSFILSAIVSFRSECKK